MSFSSGSVKEFRQHQPFTNIFFLSVLLGYKTYVSLQWLCDRILITGRKTAIRGRMLFPKSKRSGLISKPWCPIRFTHSPHFTEHGLMLDCEAAILRFERTNCAKCLHVDNARENKKKKRYLISLLSHFISHEHLSMHITPNIRLFYAYALVCSWHNWKQTISLRKRFIIIFSISLIPMLKASTNCYPKSLHQLPQLGKKKSSFHSRQGW